MAVEAAHAIDARGTVKAGRPRTIVDVAGTIGTGPSVDTDAGEAPDAVGASGAVLAHGGAQGALVHVLFAEEARVHGRAPARVGVDAVHACAAVQALVPQAVVDVLLAVNSSKS